MYLTESVKICEKKLLFLPLFGATFIVFAIAAAAAKTTCPYQDENAQEQETVGNEKEVEVIRDTKEFRAGEKADDPGQHQKGAKNSRCPAEIIDDCAKFHNDWFW